MDLTNGFGGPRDAAFGTMAHPSDVQSKARSKTVLLTSGTKPTRSIRSLLMFHVKRGQQLDGYQSQQVSPGPRSDRARRPPPAVQQPNDHRLRGPA